MKEFEYTLTCAHGISARQAGCLNGAAKEFASRVTLEKNGRKADVRKVMQVMSTGFFKGDTITVRCEGEDEEACSAALHAYFSATL